jgi:hypothetical protein
MWDGHEYRFKEIFLAISRFKSDIRIESSTEAYEKELLHAFNSLSSYSQAAIKDSRKLLDRLYSISRCTEPVSYDHDIRVCVTDYLNFDAFIQVTSSQEAQIVISLGVFIAIEDLFMRLTASMDFFSFDPSKGGNRQWHGCECFWIPSGFWGPMTRYYDYRICGYQTYIPDLSSIGVSHLFAFHSSIPLDHQRLILSTLMADIGLLWMLMHEEAHYTEGHLALLEKQYSAIFSKRKLGEITQERDENNSIPLGLLKAMEFQADCVATHATVDIICCEEYFRLMPDYCENQPAWFLRALLVAIGSTVLILQKAHSINGSAEDYPLPLTRLTTIIRYATGRIKDARKPAYRLFGDMSEEELNIAVCGALDDLETVSSLLTREKLLEKNIEGEAPVFRKTHNLGILDNHDAGEINFLSLLFSQQPILQAFMFSTQPYTQVDEQAIEVWLENQIKSGSSKLEVPFFMAKALMKATGTYREEQYNNLIELVFQSLQYTDTNDRERLLSVFELWFSEYFEMEKFCFSLKNKTDTLIPIRKLME